MKVTTKDMESLRTLEIISAVKGWVSPTTESLLTYYRMDRLVELGLAEEKTVDGCGKYYRARQAR